MDGVLAGPAEGCRRSQFIPGGYLAELAFSRHISATMQADFLS